MKRTALLGVAVAGALALSAGGADAKQQTASHALRAEPVITGPAEEVRPKPHRPWRGAGRGHLLRGMQDLAIAVDVAMVCDEATGECWVEELRTYASGKRSRPRR